MRFDSARRNPKKTDDGGERDAPARLRAGHPLAALRNPAVSRKRAPFRTLLYRFFALGLERISMPIERFLDVILHVIVRTSCRTDEHFIT